MSLRGVERMFRRVGSVILLERANSLQESRAFSVALNVTAPMGQSRLRASKYVEKDWDTCSQPQSIIRLLSRKHGLFEKHNLLVCMKPHKSDESGSPSSLT